ncbi:MAG: 4-amino-4-deoxychorismate lyase, partial [Prevotella pectinovora]
MKMHFVETIKIKDGTVMALPYHQTRMERTVRRFFPGLALHDMPRLCEIIDAKAGEGILKARVVYGEKGVETVEYAPYHMREMKTLQVVEGGDISYEYKSTDRSRLNMLAEKKGN